MSKIVLLLIVSNIVFAMAVRPEISKLEIDIVSEIKKVLDFDSNKTKVEDIQKTLNKLNIQIKDEIKSESFSFAKDYFQNKILVNAKRIVQLKAKNNLNIQEKKKIINLKNEVCIQIRELDCFLKDCF